MSIRKRYDEAQHLISQKLYEPALIILLVAVAGASERRRRHDTNNARKKTGDDSKHFQRYVKGAVPISMAGIHGAEILYKHLRCKIIHEAVIEDQLFTPENNTMSIEGDKLTFGIGLLFALSELIRTDPLGRHDFLDLLSRYENVIQYNGKDCGEFLTEFAKENRISAGRAHILVKILTGFSPEKLSAMTFDEMKLAFTEELLPNLYYFRLNIGSLTGLRSRSHDHTTPTIILDQTNQLTPDGFAIV